MSKVVRFGPRRHNRQSPPWAKRTPRLRLPSKSVLTALAGGAVIAGFVGAEIGPPALGCDIKGNISASGERIYHLPGQRYYTRTRVNWLVGERWFCSEDAAREAGWRRARV